MPESTIDRRQITPQINRIKQENVKNKIKNIHQSEEDKRNNPRKWSVKLLLELQFDVTFEIIINLISFTWSYLLELRCE